MMFIGYANAIVERKRMSQRATLLPEPLPVADA